jgi:flagellar motor switch protein FliM
MSAKSYSSGRSPPILDPMESYPVERALTQDEIDRVFRSQRAAEVPDTKRAVAYDFRRPDRIAKDQIRAIHLLHENFSRSLASSLSAYLRVYVTANLISVEQLSFAEFSQCLPSPTCLVLLGMKPYDGTAVLEINLSLIFPILEAMLGGTGKSALKITREMTEIEQVVLDGFYRIVLHDLQQAWSSTTPISFSIQGRETDPQLLQVMAPNEAVVSIAIEVRMGESTGMINIGVPSITIKMLRRKFDQQWTSRRAESSPADQERILNIMRNSTVAIEARMPDTELAVRELLELEPGTLLNLGQSLAQPVDVLVNGRRKYRARVGCAGHRRAVVIDSPIEAQ